MSQTETTQPEPVLFDALKLRCPIFQVQLRCFLAAQAKGQRVYVQTHEPAAERDTKLFCAHLGYTLLQSEQDEQGVWHLMVQV